MYCHGQIGRRLYMQHWVGGGEFGKRLDRPYHVQVGDV
jgi:hypothetical protein